MSNPSGPDRDDTPNPSAPDLDEEITEPVADIPAPVGQDSPNSDEQATEAYPIVSAEALTEVFATDNPTGSAPGANSPGPDSMERRFTAPGFDAGKTEIIPSAPETPTEAIDTRQAQRLRAGKATPQLIPGRLGGKLSSPTPRSWGWVMALILIILTLAAIAVLGTLWLTRGSRARASQEDRVRDSIHSYDIAVQNGDLATLRSITCGDIRDGYVNYDQRTWGDTYGRISAAKQYPVVVSIDEVVVNDGHAEANVTAFMAFAPWVRSTRSFDLQYRDDQWKICQDHGG